MVQNSGWVKLKDIKYWQGFGICAVLSIFCSEKFWKTILENLNYMAIQWKYISFKTFFMNIMNEYKHNWDIAVNRIGFPHVTIGHTFQVIPYSYDKENLFVTLLSQQYFQGWNLFLIKFKVNMAK